MSTCGPTSDGAGSAEHEVVAAANKPPVEAGVTERLTQSEAFAQAQAPPVSLCLRKGLGRKTRSANRSIIPQTARVNEHRRPIAPESC